MPKKKTPQQYYNECKEKGLDLPIEDYINNKTKIKHRCNQGHIYTQSPDSHLRRRGCPKCAIKKRIDNRTGLTAKKTPKEYYQECKENGYDLPIEDYISSDKKIKHRCKQGHIYTQRPNDHLSGKSCPICGKKIAIMNRKGKTKKKTSKDYYNLCKEKGIDLPLEDYRGATISINHKCKYGHVYSQQPSNHLYGYGCPICSGHIKKTQKQYYDECLVKGLDIPVSNYINNKTKIKHRCNLCGYIYLQTPKDHLHGCSCPKCNDSHGERFIRNYLDTNKINYESQKTFKDLKDKTYLSYDFFLPKQNILIEYQGIQHYSEKDYFGGEQQFKVQQYHDKLKRDYAKKNGYKLLELHYSLDNQEKVNKYLKRRIK